MTNPASQFGSPSPVEPLAAGDRIGPYAIASTIRTSSFATTYAGRDPILNRSVVIEQIHMTGSLEDDSIRQRVKQAALKTKSITSQHATQWTPLLDVFDEPRGVFIVMEYISGQALSEVMALEPLPMSPRKVMGVVAAIATALKPLHEAGLAHRDLQPTNIIMQPDGSLRLTGACIAAAADVQYALKMPTTMYMAPEILRGQKVDARSDLYALGIIAYRLLAGESQFNENFKVVVRDQRNQAMRWMKWHTNPRTTATALPIDETLPDAGHLPGIHAIVARLMQKSPAARFVSVDELLDAIRQQFLSNPADTGDVDSADQASAAPALTSPGYTAQLPKRRSATMLIVTVILSTWVVLGLVIGGTLYNQGRNEAQVARDAIVQTMQDARDAQDAGRYDDAYQLYQQVADEHSIDTRFGLISRAGMLRAEADGLMAAKQFREARESYQKLEALRPDQGVRIRQWIAESEEHLAFANGVQVIRDAIEAENFTLAREQIATWQPLVNTWSRLNSNSTEPQQLAQLQALLQQRISAESAEQTLTRAVALWETGRRDEAISSLELALENKADDEQLTDQLAKFKIQESYDSLIRRADGQRAAVALDEAVTDYQAALQIAQEFSDQPWFVAQPSLEQKLAETQVDQAYAIGQAQVEAGNPDVARRSFQRSIDIARTLGIDPAQLPAQTAINQLTQTAALSGILAQAQAAMDQENYQQALTLYQQAMSIQSTPEISQQLQLARFNHTLQSGREMVRQGKLDEAEVLFKRAAQWQPENTVVTRAISELDTLRSFDQLTSQAAVARQAKRYGEAKRLIAEAEELAEASDGVIDPEPVSTLKDDIEYEHLMVMANGYFQARQYRLALAHLRGATALRKTDEAQALLKKLEPYLVGEIEQTPDSLPEEPAPETPEEPDASPDSS